MKVPLIDIGTSRGIRIPSSILKELNRPKSFDLKVQNNQIILDIVQNPRSGWENKFNDSNDELYIDDLLDLEQWDEL
ncbi:MAG: AbrB/MazE/SpoVT family DNA-binding domain-containing protein [Campylobacterota bacterium]|nr:AbrB/MazE/SpoVT family DNA-binding domain-containing protein [Campylobacterota bacterium]